MSDNFSERITALNISNVRDQISRKKGSGPYYATMEQTTNVLTDYDTFPYPRWFRGVPDSSRPIVAEREAGWRVRHDNCYRISEPAELHYTYPNHCFEAACSTTFPCYPEYLQKFSDREALNVILNKACIAQYR